MAVDTVYPTDFQLHLFHEGNLFESYRLFGAHTIRDEGSVCTRFCVWAPKAISVRLVGEFNSWCGDGYSFQKMNEEGVWLFIADEDLEGESYKYELTTVTGKKILKADPFAFFSERRPETASIVYTLDTFEWNDERWMSKKARKSTYSQPMAIYELHAGSWRKKSTGAFLTYRELADELIPYVIEHGFTHIEMLPPVEHPLDESWGYQGTGYYSVTSRYGSPNDFMYFIDQCHQHQIGVIIDWVPGHFCKDAHGLYCFDGSYLFEYEHAHDRENLIWGTANFDLSKTEVQSFLISNALFWMEKYHIDGFRVDAVSNIIFWPNSNEKRENPYGIHFLKKLNEAVAAYDETVLMIAEDSSDWPHVTKSVQAGGLGFHYKWNMGWMNDILTYMETSYEHRHTLHNTVTFSILYAYTENFILPFSHDEVVHGKKSLLNKMPGEYWEKFAQLRLLLGFMIAHPGKKLLFMGFEHGQFAEWKYCEQLDWNLLDYEQHAKLNHYTKALMKFYKRSKPLYELDFVHEGFEWIDVHNHTQSVFSFIRRAGNSELFIVVCNFTPVSYSSYRVGVPERGTYREVLNSDDLQYGGKGATNKGMKNTDEIFFHGKPYSIQITIPPFGITIFRHVQHRKERKGNAKEKVRSDVTSRWKGE